MIATLWILISFAWEKKISDQQKSANQFHQYPLVCLSHFICQFEFESAELFFPFGHQQIIEHHWFNMPGKTDVNWFEQIGANVACGFTLGSIFGASKYYWSLGPVHNTDGNRSYFDRKSHFNLFSLSLLSYCIALPLWGMTDYYILDTPHILSALYDGWYQYLKLK